MDFYLKAFDTDAELAHFDRIVTQLQVMTFITLSMKIVLMLILVFIYFAEPARKQKMLVPIQSEREKLKKARLLHNNIYDLLQEED